MIHTTHAIHDTVDALHAYTDEPSLQYIYGILTQHSLRTGVLTYETYHDYYAHFVSQNHVSTVNILTFRDFH